MGYRFSIQNANTISHFVDGNILSFINDAFSSEKEFDPTMQYLEDIFEHFENDYCTDANSFEKVKKNLRYLADDYFNIKSQLFNYKINYKENNDQTSILGNPLIVKFGNILQKLHNIIGRAEIKSFLIPGFIYNDINEKLISKEFLRRLVRIQQGESFLILQLKELFERKEIHIFNSFRAMRELINYADELPGIIFWNDQQSIFISIDDSNEIEKIYSGIRNKSDSFDYLRKMAIQKRRDRNKYKYIFHLSDLHFGHPDVYNRKPRLLNILSNQKKELNCSSKSVTVITGDLIDSPDGKYKAIFDDFVRELKHEDSGAPIYILGNHDTSKRGFIRRANSEKAVIDSLMDGPKIIIDEKSKLVYVRFNSNVDGAYAQGFIGESQFIELGNQIDNIKNKNEYTYIALLHHHPLKIKSPDWYSKEWYEKILGKYHERSMKLKDAEQLLLWLKQRDIKFVLHGHKHIPAINDYDGINIIAAGSATGVVKHSHEEKTYISFNLLKYNLDESQIVSCSILYEDVIGAGIQHFMTKVY